MSSDNNQTKALWNLPFHELNIPDDHFYLKPEPEFIIGYFVIGKIGVSVKVNPTDSRYRLIASLYNHNGRSVLNRGWSIEEMDAVSGATNRCKLFFASLGCTPQGYFAGNNSMEDTPYGYIIGKKEPIGLHEHIVARGDNGREYIPNLPMVNPKIGDEFNLKGEGKKDPTGKIEIGTLKVKWSERHAEALSSFKSAAKAFFEANFPKEFVAYA